MEERQVLYPSLTQHTGISSFGSKHVSMHVYECCKTYGESLKVSVDVYLLKLLDHVPIIKLVLLS